MINDELLKVYVPLCDDSWFILETNKKYYELRMAGFNTIPQFDKSCYEVLFEFSDHVLVKEVYTDGENLYFRLSNNQYLMHDFANIDSDGNTSTSVSIIPKEIIDEDFGESFSNDPEFRKLNIDQEGNSD
jgi:hypothetical protein